MKVSMAQINLVVGDIEGNAAKIVGALEKGSREGSDLVVTPELSLVGYPPRDLLERPWFIEKARRAVEDISSLSRRYPGTGIVLGAPLPERGPGETGLTNSAVFIYQGQEQAVIDKSLLPTYDVFDEARYFTPGEEGVTVPFKGEKVGITICEDAWNDPGLWPQNKKYTRDPVREMKDKGATFLVNISASPFSLGKEETRFRLAKNHARKHGIPFMLVNQVGGNDELVFDGRSLFLDGKGEPVATCPAFKEHWQQVDSGAAGVPGLYRPQDQVETACQAMVLGIRDYLYKTGFSRALLGLSGGIDSAVVCWLAVEALGRENVLGITMPSPYSSPGSVEDSRALAENLGIAFKEIPITNIYQSYRDTLSGHFQGGEEGVTEENIQARARGNILMAFSNKYGGLVLVTGNKSEIAVGYCTLYGDMAGGLSPLADVPKTMVYEVARYINREREIIPRRTLEKPPSAELRPGQLDQDTLPPYPLLDQVLAYYVEEGLSREEIINKGFAADMVNWVVRQVNLNEYKRKQAAPGLKITSKAFGVGRRMPLAARY